MVVVMGSFAQRCWFRYLIDFPQQPGAAGARGAVYQQPRPYQQPAVRARHLRRDDQDAPSGPGAGRLW